MRPATTVERKVYFYRAYLGLDDDSCSRLLDLTASLTHIDGLPFSNEGRYLDEDEVTLCCWVDSVHSNPLFRFAQIRRGGLPMLERGGKLSDLKIPTDAGLAEAIHVVAFPDNIFGADFNFFGPRMTRLSSYLREKAEYTGQSVPPILP